MAWQRLGSWLVASRPGAWFYTHAAMRADRVLMPLTRGRVTFAAGMPSGLLTTTGARSGQPRTAPILFVPNGESPVVVASNGGSPHHPSWYHNARANPEVRFAIRGRTRRYRAREAVGEERERLWARAVRMYPGWSTYQRRAPRQIPVLVLDPLD